MRRETLDAAYFAALYEREADPWRFATSAYERAKYRATIASLGGAHFARALELGCSIGVLTSKLAPLCDELVAVDIDVTALAAARARNAARTSASSARRSRTTFPAVRSISSSFPKSRTIGRTPISHVRATQSSRWAPAPRSSSFILRRTSPITSGRGTRFTRRFWPMVASKSFEARERNGIGSTCYAFGDGDTRTPAAAPRDPAHGRHSRTRRRSDASTRASRIGSTAGLGRNGSLARSLRYRRARERLSRRNGARRTRACGRG